MEGITGTSCTRKRAGTPWHTSPPFGRCTSQLAPSCTRSHTENTGGLISTIRCNFLTVLPHFCLGWLEHSSLVLALHLPGSTAPETSLHCSLGTSPHTSRGTDLQTGSCRRVMVVAGPGDLPPPPCTPPWAWSCTPSCPGPRTSPHLRQGQIKALTQESRFRVRVKVSIPIKCCHKSGGQGQH